MTERDANPYVGPRPFERGERAFFFGRDAEASELVSLVVSERVLLLYAASGAGKTSLLHASVTPLLEEHEGFEVLPIARIRAQMSDEELENSRNVYTAGLLASLSETPDDGDETLERDDDGDLVEFLTRRPHTQDAQGLPAPRALVIDQFEELFTLYPRYWRQRENFIRDLGRALDADPLLRIVLAMREDYVAQLDPLAPLLPRELRTRFRLERLGPDDAIAAVVKPTQETRRTYAEGVAEKLVGDLLRFRADTERGETVEIEGEYVEPVQLQVVCQSLWDELPADVTEITEEHLRTFGDVDEVLRRFYDNAVHAAAARASMSENRLRSQVEELFITAVGTRNTVYRTAEATAGLPNAAIDELESRRVIRPEWRAGARWYELTHDRLIAPIQSSNARFRARRASRRRKQGAVAFAAAILAAVAALGSAWLLPSDDAQKQALELKIEATVLDVPDPNAAVLASDRVGTAATVKVVAQGFSGKTLVLAPSTVTPEGRTVARGESAPLVIGRGPSTVTAAIPVFVPRPRAPGVYRIVVRAETLGGGPSARAQSPLFSIGEEPGNGETPAGSSSLRLSTIGLGRVSVAGAQPCQEACAYVFTRGTAVQLTALPDPGARFVGWTEPCRRRADPICTVTIARPTTVTARFTWSTRLLGRSRNGKPIRAVLVGDPAAKRKVLVVGCVRPTECQGQAIANALTTKSPPKGVALWVIPNLNPDGVGDVGKEGTSPQRDFPCGWAEPSIYTKHCGRLRVPSTREARLAYELILRERPALSIWYLARTPAGLRTTTGKRYPAFVSRGGSPRAEAVERRFARLVGLPLEGGEPPLEPFGGYPGHPATWQRHRFPNTVAFWVELPVGPPSRPAAEKHARAILAIARGL